MEGGRGGGREKQKAVDIEEKRKTELRREPKHRQRDCTEEAIQVCVVCFWRRTSSLEPATALGTRAPPAPAAGMLRRTEGGVIMMEALVRLSRLAGGGGGGGREEGDGVNMEWLVVSLNPTEYH